MTCKTMNKYFLLFLFSLSLLSCKNNQQEENNKTKTSNDVQQLRYHVINIYPHNENAFTEGLEWSNGFLYEGTGDTEYTGNSKLAKVDLKTGKDLQKINLAKEYFGEGITILNNKIYQLTYKEQKCFVYDANTFKLIKEFTYEGEGWGMTNDGQHIIMGNGSNNLYYRNPETFAIVKTLSVSNQYGPLGSINELEFVNGYIYANVWTTFKIVKIDTNTGKVVAEANLEDILIKYAPDDLNRKIDVMNGIAYDSSSNHFFITGKYWSKLFEIALD